MTLSSHFSPLRSQNICALALIFSCLFLVNSARAQNAQLAEPDSKTLVVEDAPEMNVIAFGKTVIVRKRVKDVFSWGGDVIVEGTVSGDVAVLGGAVIQKEGSEIAGAIIIIGGAYRPETVAPKRGPDAETVVFGMFEEEFREMAAEPSTILAPRFTASFFVQRVFSALFWFVITLLFVTIAPGAVSRSITHLRTSPLKVLAVGSGVLIAVLALAIVFLQALPDHLGAILSLMAFLLLMLAYGFGRIVLQVSLGKWLIKQALAERKMPEAAAIFFGVLAWTLVLSIPYAWTLAVFALFAAGCGLVATVRPSNAWRRQD
ncbi:MAG: hypothetical protein KF855_04565 [Acidobacteria bacterium]|nr:hypothetical protein [Acidobacteriota bacterium]